MNVIHFIHYIQHDHGPGFVGWVNSYVILIDVRDISETIYWLHSCTSILAISTVNFKGRIRIIGKVDYVFNTDAIRIIWYMLVSKMNESIYIYICIVSLVVGGKAALKGINSQPAPLAPIKCSWCS